MKLQPKKGKKEQRNNTGTVIFAFYAYVDGPFWPLFTLSKE